jgi:hypothetical protein
MTRPLLRILSIGIGALILPLHASAMRIDGIPPLGTLSAQDATPTVTAEKLGVRLSGDRHLTITPWPAILPQRFDKQTITATRQLLPAGPSDRVSFAKPSESRAWLVIGSGTRRSTTLVGEWQLQLSDSGWYVTDGTSTKMLTNGETGPPTVVTVGREPWCLYLLESKVPEQQAAIALEQEPQLAWAALRINGEQKHCPP